MNPLISIIIPIYMVEKYIKKCVDSVLTQTYTNLEVILIDDGSPDRCGEICDSYANQDIRVKVFHKTNGGLSDARNYGLENAEGNFIFYLDSDDWIADNCISTLVENQMLYNADIVQTNYFYTYKDYLLKDIRGFKKHEEIKVLSANEAIELLIRNEEIKNFGWGKLIRSTLAKRFLFPKGKLFEDTYWTHHLIGETNLYVVLKAPLLYYRQREDSISYSHFNKRNLDRIEGMQERKIFIDKSFPEYSSNMALQFMSVNIELYFQAFDCGEYELANELYYRFKSSYNSLNGTFFEKGQYLLFAIHPKLFQFYQFMVKSRDYVLRKLKYTSGYIYIPR